MATIPVATSPTSPSCSNRHIRNTSPSSLSASTPSINDATDLEERGRKRKAVKRGEGSHRFKFSKLLQFNNHQQRQQQQGRSEWDDIRPPLSPRQRQQQQHHHHHHHHGLFSSKRHTPNSRFRRGSFLGFLQSHYHVFHRHSDQRDTGESREEPLLLDREKHRRGNTAVSPRSPTSSIYSSSSSSNPNIKSPHATVHSGYNVTISDFRTHATIASTRSSPVPTKVTDIVYRWGGIEQRQDMTSPIIIPTTTLANTAQSDSVSVTPNQCNQGGISSQPPSPNAKRGGIRSSLRSLSLFSKAASSATSAPSAVAPNEALSNEIVSSFNQPLDQEARQRQVLAKGHPVPSPSKHISKVLEAGAKKIGLVKKKRSIPSHYLSLPVGGTTSTTANVRYMLHSEDLSVTEFAKLAGITILPEDEEDDMTANEDLSPSDSSVTSQGMIRPGTGSTSDTLDSYKQLTSGSLGSNRLLKKTNIWDPQFWTTPSREGGSQLMAPSASSTFLPMSPVSISAPASPSIAPTIPELRISYQSKQSIGLGGSDISSLPSSATVESEGHQNAPLRSPNPEHSRRSSCSPSELRPGAGSNLSADRSRLLSPSISLKRVDQMINPSKEAVELSRDLSRQCSFTSLTAVAIELGGDRELKHTAEEANDKKPFIQQGTQQQQQKQLRDVDITPMTLRLEPSEPTGQIGRAPQPQRLAYSVALHALQPARSKQSAHRRPSFHSGSSKAGRTRSPSPSPLSRQLEISDSEGFDSPMEEKDEFDFRVSPAEPKSAISTSQAVSIHPPASRNSRFVVCRADEDADTEPEDVTIESRTNSFYHHRTQSLPLLLSDHQQSVEPHPSSPSTSSPPPSPSQSPQPTTPRPPNSAPTRKFTPGTKVGRFTLVEEKCTKHVDMLRVLEDQQQQLTSQRRVSMGDMGSSIFSDDDSYNYRNDTSAQRRRFSTASSIEGAALEWGISTLKPEENVMVFQRKKTRQLQQPQPGPQPQ